MRAWLWACLRLLSVYPCFCALWLLVKCTCAVDLISVCVLGLRLGLHAADVITLIDSDFRSHSRSTAALPRVLAHSGGIIDMDIRGDTLITCGYTARADGRLYNDFMVKVRLRRACARSVVTTLCLFGCVPMSDSPLGGVGSFYSEPGV